MATPNRSGSAASPELARRAAALRTAHSPGLRLVPATPATPATPRPPCAETVRFCEALLEAAKSGASRGVAIAVAMKGRTYIVETCGVFRADPTYGRGAVAALDDELRRLVDEASQ